MFSVQAILLIIGTIVYIRGLLGWLSGKVSTCDAEDLGVAMALIPGSGRPLEEGGATHFRTIAWSIPMDRGVWQATVHRAAQSWTRLKQQSTHAHCILCV